MRQSRTSGSVGDLGEQSLGSTRLRNQVPYQATLRAYCQVTVQPFEKLKSEEGVSLAQPAAVPGSRNQYVYEVLTPELTMVEAL